MISYEETELQLERALTPSSQRAILEEHQWDSSLQNYLIWLETLRLMNMRRRAMRAEYLDMVIEEIRHQVREMVVEKFQQRLEVRQKTLTGPMNEDSLLVD